MIWHGHSLSGCWVRVQVWCYEKQVNKMRFKSYWIRVQVTRMTWRDHSLKWGGLLDYEGWHIRGYSCNLIVPRHVSNLMLTSLWRLRYFIPCFTIFVDQLKQLIRNFSNFASFLFCQVLKVDNSWSNNQSSIAYPRPCLFVIKIQLVVHEKLLM